MGLYLRSQRSKVESGTALVEALRESASHGPLNCFTELQRAFVLDRRSRAFESRVRLDGHRLGGDTDNMARRTEKVGRDLKPPCNPGLNGVLLVSIDEEMCPLRFQRQQRQTQSTY